MPGTLGFAQNHIAAAWRRFNDSAALARGLGVDAVEIRNDLPGVEVVTVLDNRGYGCTNRLQQARGGAPFNLLADLDGRANETWVDFAAHARSLGAQAMG